MRLLQARSPEEAAGEVPKATPGPALGPELGPARAAALALLLAGPGPFAAAGPLAAGPTVGELIATCDRGRAQGNRGVDAAACEWLAAPCACRLHEAPPEQGRWCVPGSETIDATVAKVVAGLRLAPDRSAPAVAEILAGLYPCPAPQAPERADLGSP
jgi:hypothetical protein